MDLEAGRMNTQDPSRRQNLGRWGEAQAAEYLVEKGYEILSQNFRTRYGEIDIVARIENQLVFVEVKTRSSTSLGAPEISVTVQKQQHLIASAQAYLQAKPDCQDDWRIDVIAIRRGGRDEGLEIVHFENALS